MSLIITSPLRGWASALDQVPDPVFAQRMMGDGVAIEPLGDTVVAPPRVVADRMQRRRLILLAARRSVDV